MQNKQDLEYRMKVGQTTLGLICPSAAYADSLARYFQTASTSDSPDLRLRLEIVAPENSTPVPDNLFTTKSLTAEGFTIAEGLISGSYDLESKSGVIRVRDLLTKGQYTRVFEQFLYQAFYSARKNTAYDALLIHSSGVIRERDGFLFVGASDAGKSTVAALSQDKIITNDEMNLIEFSAAGPVLHATPFNGLYTAKNTEAKAPLRAVLLLNKGPEHRLDEVGLTESVTLIASQIAPPVGIEDVMSRTTGMDLLDLAHRLSLAVPVRKLTFLPDSGFWPEIDRAFPPVEHPTQGA